MNANGTEKRKKQWTKLLTPVRHDNTDPARVVLDITRSPFIQDYDRILFSNAFRMLARKTQAHPFAVNDHVHHRLMHSLEVSSAGRSLGIMAGYFLRERGELPDIFTAGNIRDRTDVSATGLETTDSISTRIVDPASLAAGIGFDIRKDNQSFGLHYDALYSSRQTWQGLMASMVYRFE